MSNTTPTLQRRAVLFDLDGTLLDSIRDIANCCNEALAEHGYQPHSIERYRSMVGNGADMLVTRAIPQESRCSESIRRVRHSYNRIYIEACHKGGGELFEGVIPLLDWLHGQGVLTGVVSNKPQSQTDAICRSKFARFLDSWQGQCDGVPLKPNPSGIFHLAEQMNAECIAYVGDSEVDIETGLAAKLPTVGVSWGFRSRKQLEAAGCTMIADNMSQLRYFLLDIITK